MLRHISRGRLLGAWFGSIAVAIALSAVILGAPEPGTWLWMSAAALVPPMILLLVYREAPTLTVAELLHAVNEERRA